MALCDIQVDPYWWVSVRSLLRTLDDMEKRFADVVVPSNRSAQKQVEAAVGEKKVGEWVRERRASVHADESGVVFLPSVEDGLELSGEELWKLEAKENERLTTSLIVSMRGTSPTLDDKVLLADLDGMLRCVQAQTGNELWRASMRTSEAIYDDDQLLAAYGNDDRWVTAAVDGQVAVVKSPFGCIALGTATGRRLWSKPPEELILTDDEREMLMVNQGVPVAARQQFARQMRQVKNEQPYDYVTLEAANGVVASITDTGRVSVRRLGDGLTLWERNLRGERLSDIRCAGDYIVTSNAAFERMHVLEQRTGRLVKRVLFRQPNVGVEFIPPVITDRVLCGLGAGEDGRDGISAHALDSPSTAPLWRFQPDKPVCRLFTPAEGMTAISHVGGDVIFVDTMTGDERSRVRVPGASAVVGGWLMDDLFVAQYREVRQGRMYPVLVGMGLRSGQLEWQRVDLAPVDSWLDATRPFGNTLAVLVEEGSASSPHQARGIGAATIDLRTGQSLGAEVSVIPAPFRQWYHGEASIRPGAVVVASEKVIRAVGMIPVQRQEGSN
jgi:outer membrane protein assembly factor BamB